MQRCVIALLLALAVALPAHAQRLFQANALRGELVVTQPPEVLLNGKPARLAPGARIRDALNMIQLSGSLLGQRLTVNYTLDPTGLVRDVMDPHRSRTGQVAVADDARASPELGLRFDAADLEQAVSGNRRKVFIKTFGCQMNVYDSDKMADVLRAADGYEPTTDVEAGRPGALQHLLGARKGTGESLLRPWPGQAPEEQGRADRRRRLRGQPGRRSHHRAGALRRHGVRPADAASPAADDRGAPGAKPAAGRYQFSRSREVRSPAGSACRRALRLRLDHGRLFEVLLLLRGALHPRRGGQPGVRRRADRGGGPRRSRRQGSDAAGPERQCLPRRDGRNRRDRRLRVAARVRARDPGHRAHPLHHQPPQRVHRAADRRPMAACPNWSITCTCRCSTAATASWRR